MKVKRNELCGYIFVICMMIFYTIDKGREHVNNILIFGLLVGAAGIIMSLKMNLKTLFWYIIFSIIPVISYVHAHDTRILVLLIAMLCGLSLDIHKVVTVMFYTKLVCFILMVLIKGYGHINGVALHGGILLMLYICMNENKIDFVKVVAMILFYIAIAIYTKTGAFIVCAGSGLLIAIIMRKNINGRKLDNLFLKYIYPICLFANYFFAAGVGEDEIPFVGIYLSPIINEVYLKLVKFLDVATSSRLTLTKYSFLRFGVSFFGGNVDYRLLELGENGYFNLDSGLIWLLQGGGILLTIGFMVLTVILMRYLLKTKHYNYVIAGIVIALWAINEDMLLGIGSNFLVIFMGQAVIDFVSERRERRVEHT